MAVKQKVVECVAQPSSEQSLQIILRALQDWTAQGVHDPRCASIVTVLGTIYGPADPTKYKQFIANIKTVEEFLAKACFKYNFTYDILKYFFEEISTSEKQLSPVMSIVLQLIDPPQIPAAVDHMLQSGYSSENLKRALRTLCIWLTKWTWTENLQPLILAFMQGLDMQRQYDVLCEVALVVVESMFKLLIMPDHRKSLGPIVVYMLSQEQNNPEVFHKILPHIKSVMLQLNKENSESSLSYLQQIVNICLDLRERYADYSNLYMELKKEFEPYIRELSYKQILNGKAWLNGSDVITTIYSPLGKVGLNNLGNTCYMNSVLQALFMTKPFRNQILLHNKTMTPLLSKLQTLFVLLQHSRRSSLSPHDISNLARPPGFLLGHQHDSSEFLGYLLDNLHEQEKNCASAASPVPCSSENGHTTSHQLGTIVQTAFGGRTASVSKCSQCDTESRRLDNFRELQLSFPNNSDNQSVQTLLDYYLQPEQLSGDNQYHCDVCDCLTDGERVTTIEEGPRRLILTLKHFRYDPTLQQRTKLLQSVKLDSYVNLDVGQYELYAAVVHCGSSVDSGHYYTFARDGDDWYKFNDCSVIRTMSEELCSLKPPETAYILFYSRQDSVDPETLHTTVLPSRLQLVVNSDHLEYESEKRRRPLKTYDVKEKRNDEPPPPGCGGSGFSNNPSNMYVC